MGGGRAATVEVSRWKDMDVYGTASYGENDSQPRILIR